MNGKKARKLRKALGMTKENHLQKDYGSVNKVEKMVYFRDKNGDLVPRKATRHCIINKNLYFYRKAKGQLMKSENNEE